MSSISIPNTIINGADVEATEVQENFDEIESYVNTNAILKDGSLAMTAALSLVAADPTTANQATRKSYVDDRYTAAAALVTAEAALRVTGDATPKPRRGASARRVAVQSISSGSATAIIFDTAYWDSAHDFFEAGSTGITVPTGSTGVYLVTGIVKGPVGDVALTDVRLNGAVFMAGYGTSDTDQAAYWATASALMFLTQGDILSMRVYQNTGGARNYTGSLSLQMISV